ncbi:VOC family protein [Tateyamaria omphalii]|uniref:Glyoxalase n=1 Tax=Tateyamaria omphalii TaxID=299262 RepID=A0A1P8MS52_9RHOB|nr:VOC family protein [Tateyamaria omphalii]APX10881.1 glyoxalase [Tateyamaria omphalii]
MSLNYVMLGSNDVAKAHDFFDAVLPEIGGNMIAEFIPHAVCYQLRGGRRIWVATPHNDKAAAAGNGNMVGLECQSRAQVETAHPIGLAKGGTDEGDPSPRPKYVPDFFGAYLGDLDGNKMSFVFLG